MGYIVTEDSTVYRPAYSKADGSAASPELTICHKYQTAKMAFEGPMRGFVNFTLRSFSRVATNSSMLGFSFPVGTEVGCRTYVGDSYHQIFVQRNCSVDSGKYEGEVKLHEPEKLVKLKGMPATA